MLSRRRALVVLSAIVAVVLCSGVTAQDAYGAGTAGSGGIVPVLASNQAWMGNAGFVLNVSQGLGGASAIVAISAQPASFASGGTQVLVSLAPIDLVLIAPLTLGGTPGVPGAGSATLSIPLTLPVNPALAGVSYYAQAGVADFAAPGTFAASAGLRITVTMPPLVAVTKSNFATPSTTETTFVDPITMTAAYPSNLTTLDPSTGSAFAHGGRDLFVARSTGNRIDRVDFSGATPAWSVFHGSVGPCSGVAFDEARDLVYTLVSTASAAPYLVAVDADASHATFGQQVGASPPLGYGVWNLSPSGNLAAIATSSCPLTSLTLVDTNPGSATYLLPVATSPMPSQYCSGMNGNPAPAKVVLSRDDQWAFILTSGPYSQYICVSPGGISRYHVPTGTWTDFNSDPNAFLPGIQPISAQSMPAVAFPITARDLVTNANGSVTWAFGFAWLLRAAYDPVVPGAFTPTSNGVSLYCGGTALGALTRDESALIGAESDWQALIVARIDPVTLAVQASFGAFSGGALECLAVR